MKADAKKQKHQERMAAGQSRNMKVAVVALLVIVAAGFALVSFKPQSKAAAGVSAPTFGTISAEELAARTGQVTIIDVRDVDSYLASHIPGALQIPVTRIQGEIPYLPKDKPIVTYCTCPNEESSGQAVEILQHGGITGATALKGGLDAWRKAGQSVESGMPPRA
jgi:rhodanese-related sulfurtransferase